MLDRNLTAAVLKSTTSVIESLGKTYWIDSGTLLSAYRDKDINQYDHDIDVRVNESEWTDTDVAELVKQCWLLGYRQMQDDKPIKAQVLMLYPPNIILDFKFCYRDERFVWYYCWDERRKPMQPMVHVYPRKFFEKMGKIHLIDRDYPCPAPIEGYIEHHYGKDWRQFKERKEQANETDMTWDYMKDPPCAMSLYDFWVMKGESPFTPFTKSMEMDNANL